MEIDPVKYGVLWQKVVTVNTEEENDSIITESAGVK